jgi:hypothetical protein
MVRKNPHAAALGRLGGSVRSRKKANAVRANGLKGGRPAKFQEGDRVRANDQAPGDYRGRVGTIQSRGPGRAEYLVHFAPLKNCPLEGHLNSWWLDRA